MSKRLCIVILAVLAGEIIGASAGRRLLQHSLATASNSPISFSMPLAPASRTDTAPAPVDQPIDVRFAAPIDPSSLTADSVTLLGPEGRVGARLELRDGALAARLIPAKELLPDSFYALYVSKVRAAKGDQLLPEAFSFQTTRLGVTVEDRRAVRASALTRILDRLTRSTIGVPPPWSPGETFQFARRTGFVKDGAWYPGEDNLDGRWHLNTPLPSMARFEDMGREIPVHTTALFGQVRRIDDLPVANVEVAIGEKAARTDDKGRFLLTDLAPGPQELYVDGTTAGRPRGGTYGQFVVGVDVEGGRVNELPHTLFIPVVRQQDRIAISSPTQKDLVLTHPEIPGLEVRIPAGTVLRDRKGNNLTELALVPTPVDRAPYPVPVNFPVYFTLLPGGAVVLGLNAEAAQGVRVVYPNYARAPTGGKHDFIFYDPAAGWKKYGVGMVSSDGRKVVPDKGVTLYAHVGASYYAPGEISGVSPPAKNPPICGASGGDPIDLRTGVFSHDWTDLAVQDVLPISVTRSYQSSDTVNRAFGIGTTFNYRFYLYNPGGTYNTPQLVLPNGSLVTFTRQSGTGWSGTWVNLGCHGPFHGAILSYRSTGSALGLDGYYMSLKDGSEYRFPKYGAGYYRTSYPQEMKDRYGNTLQFSYFGEFLTEVRSPSGRYIKFVYDYSNSRITRITDHTGRAVQYSYNATGSLATVNYPDGSAEHYSYDAAKRMTSVQDRRANTMVTNQYDAAGRVDLQTFADGAQYRFAYTVDGSGIVTAANVTDPRGKVRRVVFDATGYPATDIDGYGTPLAQTTTFQRQAISGLMTAKVDPLNRRTEYTYDSRGNVLTVKLLAGTSQAATITYTYTPDYSLIASIKDPLNLITNFTYSNGCLKSIKDALSHSTTFTCNGAGQITSIKDALAHTTQLTYDGYDLYSITDPLVRTLTYYRDALGRPIGIADPLGNTTLTEYDVTDRVIASTDPNGNRSQLGYAPNGNLTSVLDARASSITMAYDNRDRLTSRTDQLTRIERWTYDGLGNALTYVDRLGQTTAFRYDPLGRLDRSSFADGSTITTSFDAGNRPTQIVDTLGGTITHTWDARDRLTQQSSTQGIVNYLYDKANRRTSLQVGSATATTYTYDNADRLTQIKRGSETVGMAYDNADRRTSLTLPNGIVTAYAYDNADQLLSLAYTLNGSTALGDLSYGYDNAGRRTASSSTPSRPITPASDQLPTATSSDYTYNSANQLTGGNGIPSAAITYDANGDLLSDASGNTYRWDARRRLTDISRGVLIVASFQYDAGNRRTSRTDQSGNTTTYLYDGLNPIQETSGTTTRTILTGLNIDERFARDDTSGRTYFLTDALGSTVALTDAAGNAIQQYKYDPYGNVTLSNPSSTLTNPYQYTGRENDQNGLLYYRARYYSPTLHRFISEDPIGLAGGINQYAYVGGNPVSFVDPLGLTREDIDRLTELARDTQPGLNVPPPGSIGTAPLVGNGSAITNPLTLGVTVDNYYLRELNDQERQALLETIIHESIHRTNPRSDMLRRPFNHPDIYDEAERRRRGVDQNSCY